MTELGPQVYRLRLVALPGVDAIKALRLVLKSLLRRHGLRCISAEVETTSHSTNQPTQPTEQRNDIGNDSNATL